MQQFADAEGDFAVCSNWLATPPKNSRFGFVANSFKKANEYSTTVRRTRDNRLFLRNVYAYANDFRTTERNVMKARRQQQIAFDRRWPNLSSIGFEARWGGMLTLAQNGGMVFGKLAEAVYGAALCNGTGVSRGTAFGKPVAELAMGRTSAVIEILQHRAAPSRV